LPPQGAHQGINPELSESKYPFWFHRPSDPAELVKTCQNSSLGFFVRVPQYSRRE
jgi:hypothetical protein